MPNLKKILELRYLRLRQRKERLFVLVSSENGTAGA